MDGEVWQRGTDSGGGDLGRRGKVQSGGPGGGSHRALDATPGRLASAGLMAPVAYQVPPDQAVLVASLRYRYQGCTRYTTTSSMAH